MPKVLSITPLSPADCEQIRGVDPSIELMEAGGWFDDSLQLFPLLSWFVVPLPARDLATLPEGG